MQIWNGVFPDYERAAEFVASSELETGLGYGSQEWQAQSLESLKSSIASTGLQASRIYPISHAIAHLARNRESVEVLDVGGNLGQTYFEIKRSLAEARFTFSVLETREFLDLPEIRKALHALPISFVTPESAPQDFYDIVHFGSTVQYFQEWKSSVRRAVTSLAKDKEGLLIFSDLPAGDIPTFATNQTFYSSQIPCWFFNEGQFTEFVCSLGFQLVLKEGFHRHGCEYFPESSLPVSHQITSSMNLVFQRAVRSTRLSPPPPPFPGLHDRRHDAGLVA